jgi:UDP-N-acetylglucosamine--N-acetylmuramyl-(pentapeptide) pyrophosphoryl-undecaprenol N-acetylglucosamine transferase
MVQSGRLLRRFRPEVVLATGGYATVPVALAAALRRVPIVLYLPDVYPGWAVRLLAPLATRIAVSGDGALKHLPRRKCVVTGYPTRAAFFSAEREAARRALGFRPDVPMLLVTGASQGSHAINLAVFEALPALLAYTGVLHQTGTADLADAEARAAALPGQLRDRYRPVAYLDDMASAMIAADLAVMRSGASSLAEPPAAGLPTVLVPGTFAGAHQRHNAAFMVKSGAAVMLEESELGRLPGVVLELLGNHERLQAMAAATALLAHRDAAEAIAGVVLEAAV